MAASRIQVAKLSVPKIGSGASRSGRTELETIMQFMHTGDELVVLRLDRLKPLHSALS
ncbi:hypothetical protein [Novosphingobium sp. G106]|uniref:hypothetical protein n=1 Tax=Novosphingobium sp. G106 TaxID=2849500 RepID=UPI0020C23E4E|nr:hypothetical protein [Novosphingobium sp. G106]